eukprot:TRINITY_DN9480_c0_g1_i1.p1 TRINITY_DN9480_c0_g1~~TRINITY_DN9480_c0_g1_i1.p1  ORF type:complete len:428 (-),score=97.84 TRINITY_DN9480_c0_g1_i1:239-1522(-)
MSPPSHSVPISPNASTIDAVQKYKELVEQKYTVLYEEGVGKFQHELLATSTRKGPPSPDSSFSSLQVTSPPIKEEKKLKPLFKKERERSVSSPLSPISATAPQVVFNNQSLVDILDSEFRRDRVKKSLPSLVIKALAFLDNEERLKTEGIFRMAGNQNEIDILLKKLEHGLPIPPNSDIHVVSNVLKKFLRQLSEPLFTYKLHQNFIDTVSEDISSTVQVDLLSMAIESLPRPNKELIKALLLFLGKVASYKDSNMMHSQNLGIVFGPSLFKPPPALHGNSSQSSSFLMVDNRPNSVVTLLIDNVNTLFPTLTTLPITPSTPTTPVPDPSLLLNQIFDIIQQQDAKRDKYNVKSTPAQIQNNDSNINNNSNSNHNSNSDHNNNINSNSSTSPPTETPLQHLPSRDEIIEAGKHIQNLSLDDDEIIIL